MKVAEFAAGWIDELERSGVYAPQTIKTMRSNLEARIIPTIGDREIPELVASDMNIIAKGYATSSVTNRRVLATLAALLRDYHEETGEPVPDVAKVKLPREQAAESAVALEVAKLDAIAARAGGYRQWEILFLAYTGLRVGEALALQWWRDVPVGYWGLVSVRESRLVDGTFAPTKNRRSRRVHLTERAQGAIKAMWRLREKELGTEQLVFQSSRDQLRRALAPDSHPHQLRHTYASLMLAAGAPITFVADQMGHANPGVTLRVYSHFIGDPKSVIESVNEALR